MALSKEVRSPFLFPSAIRVFAKYCLQGIDIISSLQHTDIDEYIPEKIFDQPKKGFSVPY